MLHHYNYSTSLSHFLSYHQFEDQTSNENDQSTASALCEEDARCKGGSAANNKSFTIAAILGLKGAEEKVPVVGDDLNVVNLSVHPGGTEGSARALVSNCSRLQLPGRHSSSAVAVTGHHYSVGPGCGQPRHAVRGLKQLSNLANKKSCKSKRVRTIFTPEQLERLEAEFERQQYMVGPERLYLAHTLQLTEAQVKVWFQNRRIKWRKHHLELTHQRLAVLKQQQILLDDHNPDIQDTNSSSTDT